MKQAIVGAVNWVSSRFGFTCLPTWQVRGINLVWLLQRVFKDHSIEHVVDVGANQGQYVNWLRRHVGYRGQITSFEPLDSAFRTLQTAARSDPLWRVENLALGKEAGSRTLNVMSNDTFSSFHAPSTGQTAHYRDLNKVVRSVSVEVRRLDSLDVPANSI